MINPNEIKNHNRTFYQILLTVAYGLNTDCKYNYILRFMIYFYTINWFGSIVLAPSCILLSEKNLKISFTLELIQHMTGGMFYVSTYVVFILKKNAIASNYNDVQTIFIQWSNRRGMNPDDAYRKSLQKVKSLIMPFIYLMCSISFGPLMSAINDVGKMPLDSRSHFTMFWPSIIEINTFNRYGIIFSLQTTLLIFIYVSTISLNFGLMVFFYELTYQFDILLSGIKNAFHYRMDENFQNMFKECICHHQTIIKFLNDFKSYFKWIIIIELVAMQVVIATVLYNITKGDDALGYKVKTVGVFFFNLIPLYFHCHIGEVILNMHNSLSNHLYEMTWYDMPNKHKQFIVIMYQRTQKDMSLNLALFSSEMASRKLMAKFMKQVYTILNLLLHLN